MLQRPLLIPTGVLGAIHIGFMVTRLAALGRVAGQRGRLEEAETYYRQALKIDQEVQDLRGEGVDLGDLGDILVQRGDLAGAQANYERVLAIMQQVGDTGGEGVALYKLALMFEQNDDLDEAEVLHRKSLQFAIDVQAA